MSQKTENSKAEISVSFDGPPKRFIGNDSDIDSVEIWTKKFETVVSIKGWTKNQALDVFKVWLEGPAAKWQFENDDEKKKFFTLSDWTNEMTKEFKDPKTGNNFIIFGLSDFLINKDERIGKFNARLKSYLNKIPSKMYTDETIKEI
ncbi:hypothetical protein AYI68_g7190 [Smittium mucronatum]|uniref:Retrotransposon gag domain-containing protein n=1 Tax=Smittium mucronatum TaxID=133383 RepID=A0A1R0GPD7_9FUNG|nr:hypothetical protein AYI68_g7189 [Smittium mucronatum]OLY78755.1 hypothetical protein AYI68_g7190 [Smittium mucronatum]